MHSVIQAFVIIKAVPFYCLIAFRRCPFKNGTDSPEYILFIKRGRCTYEYNGLFCILNNKSIPDRLDNPSFGDELYAAPEGDGILPPRTSGHICHVMSGIPDRIDGVVISGLTVDLL